MKETTWQLSQSQKGEGGKKKNLGQTILGLAQTPQGKTNRKVDASHSAHKQFFHICSKNGEVVRKRVVCSLNGVCSGTRVTLLPIEKNKFKRKMELSDQHIILCFDCENSKK